MPPVRGSGVGRVAGRLREPGGSGVRRPPSSLGAQALPAKAPGLCLLLGCWAPPCAAVRDAGVCLAPCRIALRGLESCLDVGPIFSGLLAGWLGPVALVAWGRSEQAGPGQPGTSTQAPRQKMEHGYSRLRKLHLVAERRLAGLRVPSPPRHCPGGQAGVLSLSPVWRQGWEAVGPPEWGHLSLWGTVRKRRRGHEAP